MGRKSREKKERRQGETRGDDESGGARSSADAEALVSFHRATDADIDRMFSGSRVGDDSEPITPELMDALVQAGTITRKMADEALEAAKHGARYDPNEVSLVYPLEADL